jgi:hypothetical protein
LVKWGSLLEILYKNKLRFVDFHPDGVWKKKNRSLEYSAKGEGNGKITVEMVKPFLQSMDGGGVKVNIVAWSPGEIVLHTFIS